MRPKTIHPSRILPFLVASLLSAEVWSMPFVRDAPVLDGALADPVWRGLAWHSSFTCIGTRDPAKAQTRFKCFHNGKSLFFAVECDEPGMQRITCCHRPDSVLFWKNDTLELTLIPDPQLISFYKLIIDSKGERADMLGMDDNTHTGKYVYPNPWESGAEIRTGLHPGGWTVEAAIPFGALDYDANCTDRWRLNVARNRWTSTPEELSSWSVLPHRTHLIPKAFNLVTVEGFQAGKYACGIENFKGRVEHRDDTLTYHVSANLHNETDSFRCFLQTCVMTSLKDGRRTRAEGVLPLQARSFAESSLSIPGLQNGDYRLTWNLYARSRPRPVLCKSMTRNARIDYVPMTVGLLRPCYRNSIYASMPDKTIEARIELLESSGVPLTVELAGQGIRQVRRLDKAEAVNRVVFDGEALPDGDYRLTATCRKDQRTLSAAVRIRKLPYRKGEVWLDSRGVFHIDGKEFLSYGWYVHSGETVRKCYNTVLNTARYADLEEAQACLRDNYRRRGQRSLVVPFQDLGGWNDWRWVVFKDPETRRKDLTEDQRRKIVEFVGAIAREDGLLGYYMADEPESRGGSPGWYEQAYKVIAETDPYHPCFMLNWGLAGVRRFHRGCDVLLPDCYPQYFEDGSTSKPRWAPSEYAKVATSLRPAWQMPIACSYPDLSFDGKRGIPATYYDQRSQVFQAFIHNVKGISVYAWFEAMRFSSAILGAPAVAETVYELRRFLVQDTVPGGVRISTAPRMPHFQAGLKTRGGQLCLLAVNTSLEPVKVDFRLSSGFSGRLHREGLAGAVDVDKGCFSDTLGPNETRIYLSDPALAARLVSPAAVRERIKAHRLARRKPGNLVGLGELLPIEYLRYGQGECPPGVPVITASSDATMWTTRESGSLYYLVDGLAEILSAEFGWSPRRQDKAPWLDFRLPRRSPVRRVVLHSQGGNLKAGRVLVNGKAYPFEDRSRSPVLAVGLPGETTDDVRIEFTDFHRTDGSAIAGRLLTEVEIY